MERAGDILGRIIGRFDHPEVALGWLASAWPGIVGNALASRTRPLRCEGGRLEISAESKAWQKQLEEMKHEFRARINQSWGGPLVREVKFVAAKPARRHISHELDNDHIPFIRRRKS